MRCRKPFHGCGRNASAAKDRYTKRCVCVCARARARACVLVYLVFCVYVYLCVSGCRLYICREKQTHPTPPPTHTQTQVLCTAKDCPIFYRRRKAHKDLIETHKQLERFSTSW